MKKYVLVRPSEVIKLRTLARNEMYQWLVKDVDYLLERQFRDITKNMTLKELVEYHGQSHEKEWRNWVMFMAGYMQAKREMRSRHLDKKTLKRKTFAALSDMTDEEYELYCMTDTKKGK